jgi:hypothetical protein
MDVRVGTLNVRSDILKTVARELAKYLLDYVAVQGVRWDKGGSGPRED